MELSQEDLKIARERSVLRDVVEDMCVQAQKAVTEAANRENLETYAERLQHYEGKLDVLNRLLDTIDHFDENAQLTKAIQKSESITCRARATVKGIQIALSKPPYTQIANSSAVPANDQMNQQNLTGGKHVRKLTPLTLEKFDGSVLDWIPFWTRFESRVHSDRSLTNLDKFDYLLMFLSKRVKEKLSQIPVMPEFYGQAIETLKTEYGRQDRLMEAYSNRLMGLSPVRSRFDAEGIRQIVMTVTASLNALALVEVTVDQIAPLFYPRLKKSVPAILYLEFKSRMRVRKNIEENIPPANNDEMASISSSTGNGDSLGELLEFLKEVLSDLDELGQDDLHRLKAMDGKSDSRSSLPTLAGMTTSLDQEKFNKQRKGNGKQGSRRDHPAKPQSMPASNSAEGMKPYCLFCKVEDTHESEVCPKSKDMNRAERREAVKQSGYCFKCLRYRHRAASCRMKVTCNRSNGSHPSSLCYGQDKSTAAHCCNSSLDADTKNFKTVTAYAVSPKGEKVACRILFDSASQNSFISERLTQALGFNLDALKKREVMLNMLNGTSTATQVGRVDFRLQSQEATELHWISCLTIPEVSKDRYTPSIDAATGKKLREKGITLSDKVGTKLPVDILVGVDHMVELVSHEAIRLSPTLEVVKTAFGWSLFGCSGRNDSDQIATFKVGCFILAENQIQEVGKDENEDLQLTATFKKFVESDALALDDEPASKNTEFIEEFRNSVEFDKTLKRFVVRLPFKEGVTPGINRKLCMARLSSLTNRLRRAGLLEQYEKELRDMMQLGFCEEVRELSDIQTSYLPHREVSKKGSLTTKLRVVFDASAHESGGLSLNDALESGPNLNLDMLAVLLNFRSHRIPLIADIEKSFPQIVIDQSDRDYMRFLWTVKGELKTFRLTRNYFGLRCSSFILAVCIQMLLDKYESRKPESVQAFRSSHYVDDLASGAKCLEEAQRLYKELKEILGHGSFNLRKWISSSKEMMDLFEKNGESVTNLTDTQLSSHKVLGLEYNHQSDELSLSVQSVVRSSSNQKSLPNEVF